MGGFCLGFGEILTIKTKIICRYHIMIILRWVGLALRVMGHATDHRRLRFKMEMIEVSMKKMIW